MENHPRLLGMPPPAPTTHYVPKLLRETGEACLDISDEIITSRDFHQALPAHPQGPVQTSD